MQHSSIKVQKEVYGDSAHYYATDPFHEGGNTGGMDSAVISQKVLASMMTADPHATWVSSPGREIRQRLCFRD